MFDESEALGLSRPVPKPAPKKRDRPGKNPAENKLFIIAVILSSIAFLLTRPQKLFCGRVTAEPSPMMCVSTICPTATRLKIMTFL